MSSNTPTFDLSIASHDVETNTELAIVQEKDKQCVSALTLAYAERKVRVLALASPGTSKVTAYVHAADVCRFVEKNLANIPRMFKFFSMPEEKVLMQVKGSYNHTIGQRSIVLTTKGLFRLVSDNPKMRADLNLRRFLFDTVLAAMKRLENPEVATNMRMPIQLPAEWNVHFDSDAADATGTRPEKPIQVSEEDEGAATDSSVRKPQPPVPPFRAFTLSQAWVLYENQFKPRGWLIKPTTGSEFRTWSTDAAAEILRHYAVMLELVDPDKEIAYKKKNKLTFHEDFARRKPAHRYSCTCGQLRWVDTYLFKKHVAEKHDAAASENKVTRNSSTPKKVDPASTTVLNAPAAAASSSSASATMPQASNAAASSSSASATMPQASTAAAFSSASAASASSTSSPGIIQQENIPSLQMQGWVEWNVTCLRAFASEFYFRMHRTNACATFCWVEISFEQWQKAFGNLDVQQVANRMAKADTKDPRAVSLIKILTRGVRAWRTAVFGSPHGMKLVRNGYQVDDEAPIPQLLAIWAPSEHDYALPFVQLSALLPLVSPPAAAAASTPTSSMPPPAAAAASTVASAAQQPTAAVVASSTQAVAVKAHAVSERAADSADDRPTPMELDGASQEAPSDTPDRRESTKLNTKAAHSAAAAAAATSSPAKESERGSGNEEEDDDGEDQNDEDSDLSEGEVPHSSTWKCPHTCGCWIIRTKEFVVHREFNPSGGAMHRKAGSACHPRCDHNCPAYEQKEQMDEEQKQTTDWICQHTCGCSGSREFKIERHRTRHEQAHTVHRNHAEHPECPVVMTRTSSLTPPTAAASIVDARGHNPEPCVHICGCSTQADRTPIKNRLIPAGVSGQRHISARSSHLSCFANCPGFAQLNDNEDPPADHSSSEDSSSSDSSDSASSDSEKDADEAAGRKRESCVHTCGCYNRQDRTTVVNRELYSCKMRNHLSGISTHPNCTAKCTGYPKKPVNKQRTVRCKHVCGCYSARDNTLVTEREVSERQLSKHLGTATSHPHCTPACPGHRASAGDHAIEAREEEAAATSGDDGCDEPMAEAPAASSAPAPDQAAAAAASAPAPTEAAAAPSKKPITSHPDYAFWNKFSERDLRDWGRDYTEVFPVANDFTLKKDGLIEMYIVMEVDKPGVNGQPEMRDFIREYRARGKGDLAAMTSKPLRAADLVRRQEQAQLILLETQKRNAEKSEEFDGSSNKRARLESSSSSTAAAADAPASRPASMTAAPIPLGFDTMPTAPPPGLSAVGLIGFFECYGAMKVQQQQQQQQQQARSPASGSSLCVVCEDRERSVLFPCNHIVCCFPCAEVIRRGQRRCPICNARIGAKLNKIGVKLS